MAVTDPAIAVTHHHQSGKAEAAAALHNLGDPVDVYQLVDQVAVALFLVAATATATAFTAITSAALATFTAAAGFALLFALLFGCHLFHFLTIQAFQPLDLDSFVRCRYERL
jgi:hypothetical protein